MAMLFETLSIGMMLPAITLIVDQTLIENEWGVALLEVLELKTTSEIIVFSLIIQLFFLIHKML